VEDDDDEIENIKLLQESIENLKVDQQHQMKNIKVQLRKLKGTYEKKMNQKVELGKFDKLLKKIKVMQEKGTFNEEEFDKRTKKLKAILVEEQEKNKTAEEKLHGNLAKGMKKALKGMKKLDLKKLMKKGQLESPMLLQ